MIDKSQIPSNCHCEHCNKHITDLDDIKDDMVQEASELFPSREGEFFSIVCDDCFKQWIKERGPYTTPRSLDLREVE